MIMVMTVGMTFVISAGFIDISVSGVVPMAGILAAVLLRSTNNLLLAITIPVLFGVCVGMANGLLVTKLAMPAFIVTIGTQGVLKGIAMWISATKSIPIYNDQFYHLFGYGTVGAVPTLLIWAMLVAALGYTAYNHLPYGRRVLSIGGNRTAAKYTGINVDRTIICTYLISALCAVLAGFMYASRTQTARYTFGDGDEMNIIAATVLGGTLMSGGKGSIIGALVGALLIGMINNGLIIGGLEVSQQAISRGLIILVAVAINNITNRQKS